MTTDPNADLIGHIVTLDGIEYAIQHSVMWSQQYVQLRRNPPHGDENDYLVRPAAVVRRHLQLVP